MYQPRESERSCICPGGIPTLTVYDFPIRFSNCSDGSYIFSFSIISVIICSAICLQSNVILAILRSIYGGYFLADLYIYFGFWCVHHDLRIATNFYIAITIQTACSLRRDAFDTTLCNKVCQ